MSEYVVDPLLIDREELRKMLKENVMVVDFKKANGDDRIMRCTLMQEYLPEATPVKSKKAMSTESIAVWDVDLSEWRSFRIDSITSIRKSALP